LAEVDVIKNIENTLTNKIYVIPFLPKEQLLTALLEFYDTKQLVKEKK